MTEFYFIRHGLVHNPDNIIYGKKPFPLSIGGRTQIQRTGEYLHYLGIKPDRIITSPILRTLQSTQTMVDFFKFGTEQIQINEALSEVNFGPKIEGQSASLFDELGDEIWDLSDEKPKQVADRMESFILGLSEIYPDETIFIVGHGDPISIGLERLANPTGVLRTTSELEQIGRYVQKGDVARINITNGFRSKVDFISIPLQPRYSIEGGKGGSPEN